MTGFLSRFALFMAVVLLVSFTHPDEIVSIQTSALVLIGILGGVYVWLPLLGDDE